MKRTLGFGLAVIQLTALQGCKELLKKAASETGGDGVDTISQPDSLDPTSSSLLDGLRLRLAVSDVSSDAKEKIVKGAKAELESGTKGAKSALNLAALNVDSDSLDFKTKLSLVVKGAAKAMAGISELNSGGKRLGVLKDVVKFGVESTKKFQSEMKDTGSQSVIADVVKTLVANVDAAGVSEEERADAVVSMVGSAVSALKDAAVEDDSSRIDSMKAIVDAAVSAIADAGVAATSMTAVVADIAESSLKSAAEAGVSQELIAEAAKAVTQVAVESATRLADTSGIKEIKATEISSAVVQNVVAALSDAGVAKEVLAQTAAAVAGASVAALVESKIDATLIAEAQSKVQESAATGLQSSGQLSETEILQAQKEIASTTSSATAAVVENKPPFMSEIADQFGKEDSELLLKFEIGDSDGFVMCSDVIPSSENPLLIPNSPKNMSIASLGGSFCSLRIVPALNESGNSQITLSLSDGTKSANSTVKRNFNVSISAVNDAPFISRIPDLLFDEGQSKILNFSIADAENKELRCSDVQVSKLESTQVADPSAPMGTGNFSQLKLIVAGSGTDCTLSVIPGENENGKVGIGLSLSDGSDALSQTTKMNFFLNVRSVNDAPVISQISDTSIDEDTSTGDLPFTVSDIESPVNCALVKASGSNTELLPTGSLKVLGGQGKECTISATPAANRFGGSEIRLSVDDGSGAANAIALMKFQFNVKSVDDAPFISEILNQVVNEDGVKTIPFTIDDVDNVVQCSAVVVTSGNQTLIPNELSNLSVAGSGKNCMLTLKPAANEFGEAPVTVSLPFSSSLDLRNSKRTFVLSVLSVNDAPSISKIDDLSMDEDQITDALPFTILDVDSSVRCDMVQARSGNLSLFPSGSLTVVGDAGQNCSLSAKPADNLFGEAMISLSINDGSQAGNAITEMRFKVIVKPVNDAPVISPIVSPVLLDQGESKSVSFSIHDVDDALGCSNAMVYSDNTSLFPVGQANLSATPSSGDACTLRLTPVAAESGTATINLTVADPKGGTATTSLSVSVRPVSYVTFQLRNEVNFLAWQDGALPWQEISLADCGSNGCSKTIKVVDPQKRISLSFVCDPTMTQSENKVVRSVSGYVVASDFDGFEVLTCVSGNTSSSASGGNTSDPNQQPQTSSTPSSSASPTPSGATMGSVSVNGVQCQSNENCSMTLIQQLAVVSSGSGKRYSVGLDPTKASPIPMGNYRAFFEKSVFSEDSQSQFGRLFSLSFKDISVGSEAITLDPSASDWTPVALSERQISLVNVLQGLGVRMFGSQAGENFGFAPLSFGKLMNSGLLPLLKFTVLGDAGTPNPAPTDAFFDLTKETSSNQFDSYHVSMKLFPAEQNATELNLSILPQAPLFTRASGQPVSALFAPSAQGANVMFMQNQPLQRIESVLHVSPARLAAAASFVLPEFSDTFDAWKSEWKFLDYARIQVNGRSSIEIDGVKVDHGYQRSLEALESTTPPNPTRPGVCYGTLPPNADAPLAYMQQFDWSTGEWTPKAGQYWSGVSSSSSSYSNGGSGSSYGGSVSYPETPECRFTCKQGFAFANGACVPATLNWSDVQDVPSTQIRTGRVVGSVSDPNGGPSSAIMEGNSVALLAAGNVFLSRDGGMNWSGVQGLSGKYDSRITFAKDAATSLIMTHQDFVTQADQTSVSVLKVLRLDSAGMPSETILATAPQNWGSYNPSSPLIQNKDLFTASNGDIFSTFLVAEISGDTSNPQLLKRLKLARLKSGGANWETGDLTELFASGAGSLSGCDDMSSFQMAESLGKLVLVQFRNCGSNSVAATVLQDLDATEFNANAWSPVSRQEGLDSSFFNGKIVGRSDGFRIYSNWRMGSYLTGNLSSTNAVSWQSPTYSYGEPMTTLVGTGSNTVFFSFRNGGSQLVSIQESALSTSQMPMNPVPSQLIASDASSMKPVVAVGDASQIHVFWMSLLNSSINSIRHAKLSGSGQPMDTITEPFQIPNRTLSPLNDISMAGAPLSGESIGSQGLVISGGSAYRTLDAGATWKSASLFAANSWLTISPYAQAKKVIADQGKFHLFADGVYAFTNSLESPWTVRARVPSFQDLPSSMYEGREWAVSGEKILVPSVSCHPLDPKNGYSQNAPMKTELYFVRSDDAGINWSHSSVFDLSSQFNLQNCPPAVFYSVKIETDRVLLLFNLQNGQNSSLQKAVWTASSNSWTMETLLSSSSGESFYINGGNLLDGHLVITYTDNSYQPGEQSRLASYNSSLVLESDNPVGSFNMQSGMVSRCLALSASTLCPAGNGSVYQRMASSQEWQLKQVDTPLWGMQLLMKFTSATGAESVSLIYQNPFDGFLKVSGSTDGGTTWQ
ncbi:MAG: hypothetical protein RIR26_2127 [Pseudomonadota bacterium]|jgi:hypothetical protein